MFITLTHSTGRILVNINSLTAVVQHNGQVYIATQGSDPVKNVAHHIMVSETYDDIVARIEEKLRN